MMNRSDGRGGKMKRIVHRDNTLSQTTEGWFHQQPGLRRLRPLGGVLMGPV